MNILQLIVVVLLFQFILFDDIPDTLQWIGVVLIIISLFIPVFEEINVYKLYKQKR